MNRSYIFFAVNIYYTKVESKWPWMRSGVTVSCTVLFLFYFATPVLFCNILNDSGVCPREPGKPYSGWMSALYFASTTLSTVRLFGIPTCFLLAVYLLLTFNIGLKGWVR
jgi:hypothetical protein